MFSPRTRWVGLRLNRCGSFAHVLEVGCTLGLIRYRFHKAGISYTQLNEPQRSLTIQQVRHIRTCQADGTNWPRDRGHHRSQMRAERPTGTCECSADLRPAGSSALSRPDAQCGPPRQQLG
jgi:hypothetical protein